MSRKDRTETTLRELTRLQGRSAPEFDRLLQRSSRRAARRTGLPRSWAFATGAVALALLVAVGGFALRDANGTDSLSLEEIQRVAKWQAPTDVFLPSVEGAFSTPVPPLGRTEFEIYTGVRNPATPENGNPR